MHDHGTEPLYSVFALNGTSRHNPGNDKSALTTLSLGRGEEENETRVGRREGADKTKPIIEESDEHGAETGALAGTGLGVIWRTVSQSHCTMV